MEGFTHIKEFRLNKDCPDYGKLHNDRSKPNFKKIGKTKAGVQRNQCRIRLATFTDIYGTLFCREPTLEHQTLKTMALLAEGNHISSLSRAKGFKEDTICRIIGE